MATNLATTPSRANVVLSSIANTRAQLRREAHQIVKQLRVVRHLARSAESGQEIRFARDELARLSQRLRNLRNAHSRTVSAVRTITTGTTLYQRRAS